MASYKNITLIQGLVDSVSSAFCGNSLQSLEEVGIFYDIEPSLEDRNIAAAIRHDERTFGIASWALSPLYVEGRMRLRDNKSDLAAASAILVAAPDYSTAWNIRKSQLESEQVADELLFCSLILRRSPKSAESWSHRSWVLRTFGCAQEQLENELQLAWLAATRAPSNYYAGVHRVRIVELLDLSTLVVEVQQSRKWLRTHISDSSGWWYHRVILTRAKSMGIVVWDDELEFCSKLTAQYQSGHQCIRIHEKWLISMQNKGA